MTNKPIDRATDHCTHALSSGAWYTQVTPVKVPHRAFFIIREYWPFALALAVFVTLLAWRISR